MAKTDFTAKETTFNSFIGSKNTENATNTNNTENTTNTKRHYNRLDPRKDAPEEYRFTARMPGLYGLYLNEKAWRTRSSITAVLQELVKADMEKHPEILEALDELNAK